MKAITEALIVLWATMLQNSISATSLLEGGQKRAGRQYSSMPHHMQKKIAFKRSRAANKKKKAPHYDEQAFLTKDFYNRSMSDRFIECIDQIECSNMDISSFISNVELGCNSQELIGFTFINDLWGWTDPEDGSEYAIVGMFDGTSFVDITNPRKPVVLGFLETSGELPEDDFLGIWRDIKVVNNAAYIGAEVSEHGLQVFDLTRLRTLPRPDDTGNDGTQPSGPNVPRLEADNTITTIGSSHNIVAFPELNKVLAVGLRAISTVCDTDKAESVAVFNLDNPLEPYVEECLSGDYNICGPDTDIACTYDGYVHDGQCFVYDGPDSDYSGIPMCVFFVEKEIVLFNMESKEIINIFTYPEYAYGKGERHVKISMLL